MKHYETYEKPHICGHCGFKSALTVIEQEEGRRFLQCPRCSRKEYLREGELLPDAKCAICGADMDPKGLNGYLYRDGKRFCSPECGGQYFAGLILDGAKRPIKTETEWQKSRLPFGEFAQVGDRVDEGIYDYFLGVVFPIRYGGGVLQCGEPAGWDSRGNFTYITFHKIGPDWVYMGEMAEQKYNETANQKG